MTYLERILQRVTHLHDLLPNLITKKDFDMTVAEMNDKLDAMKTKLDALIAAHATGINPADLDPLGAKVDAMAAEVDAAMAPPAA